MEAPRPFGFLVSGGAGVGRLQLRHRAAIADGEGVFRAVFAFYAPVFEPDVEGALGRAADGKRAGGEDGVVILAGGAVRIDELIAVGLIVFYQPIVVSVVVRFLLVRSTGLPVICRSLFSLLIRP
ncbi:hypothetical protein HMPREF0658_1425 [Hoylesella marshii DSM 16973 = JCM 13450]|uniref:Uncharacterized protein n=1 Tax=Hoylesella marshii DSM 16973 = JCM 13450 TaxID=862515 RepID=E0NTC3_9BACT|nr:hypothetical protein HMPREF0658_1425 [Hoylesella marshii DSM 16973 = JCM 13450]